MSMKTGANHGWVIPKEVLKKELHKEMEFIEEHEEQFAEWILDNSSISEERELTIQFEEIYGNIKQWGKSKGLELVLDYTCMDEDNDEVESWLCFCENAYTLNPAFKEIGGEQLLWTTFG